MVRTIQSFTSALLLLLSLSAPVAAEQIETAKSAGGTVHKVTTHKVTGHKVTGHKVTGQRRTKHKAKGVQTTAIQKATIQTAAKQPTSKHSKPQQPSSVRGRSVFTKRSPTPSRAEISPRDDAASKGWGHVVTLLTKAGVNHQLAESLFSDPRIPVKTPVYFSLEPRESGAIYQGVNSRKNLYLARECYFTHQNSFNQAERQFGVPRQVVLALIQVESQCGKNTGNERVFHGLARLASAAESTNIEHNFRRLAAAEKIRYSSPSAKAQLREKLVARGQWLEQTFLPHLVATIELATSLGLAPLELRGSAAGAVGFGQFLPGNVFAYGVSARGQKFSNPFKAEDAILSVANFLKSHGWNQQQLNRKEMEAVIRHYNRSEPYVKTVLGMSDLLPSLIKAKGSEFVALEGSIKASIPQRTDEFVSR